MPNSFLQDFLTDVRQAVDDEGVGKKFSDAEILRHAGLVYRRVFRDINAISSRPVVLTYDVSVVSTTRRYLLPPCIGEVLLIGEWDDSYGSYIWVNRPQSRHGYSRVGARLVHNRIVFDADPQKNFTLRIEYIPSGDFFAHEAVQASAPAAGASTSFTMLPRSGTVTRGVIDDRNGAYIGSLLRFWSNVEATNVVVVNERIVTDYVVSPDSPARTATMDMSFTFENEVYRYEVLPSAIPTFHQVVMLGTAMLLCSMSSMMKRRQALHAEYVAAIRMEKMFEAYHSPYEQKWHTNTREAYLGGFAP